MDNFVKIKNEQIEHWIKTLSNSLLETLKKIIDDEIKNRYLNRTPKL